MTSEGGPDRRSRAERLFGAPADRADLGAMRPERPVAPRAVRQAALVVAVEAAALAVVAGVLLVLTLTSTPDSVGRALAEVVYVGAGAAVLAAAAVGLWRVSAWARGPVVVLQLLLGALGWSVTSTGDRPLIGVPVLVLVALALFLLSTPEARLAFARR